MNAASHRYLSRTATDALILGGVVFAAAMFGILSRPTNLLAAFWPANALVVGLVLRNPRLASPQGWTAVACAFVSADMLTGSTLTVTLCLTAGNFVSIFTGYFLFNRLAAEDRWIDRPRSVLSFLLVSTMSAATTALVGAVLEPLLFGRDAVTGWIIWFSAELANNITVLPVVLTAPRRMGPVRLGALLRWPRTEQAMRALPALALVASMVASVLIGGPGGVVVPLPALLWCAVSYSIFTTSVLTLLFSMWEIIAISSRWLLTQPADESLFFTLISIRLGVALAALGPIMVAGVTASLAASEARWNFALESAGQGVWDSNLVDGRTFYSPRWRTMLGYRADEVGESIGDWTDRVHPDDRDRVLADLDGPMHGAGEQYEGEFRIRHGDGRWLWMLGRGRVIEWTDDGSPLRMIGTQTDITALKESQTQRALFSERMQIAVRAGGIGIWEFDFQHGRIIWDDRMHELYDMEPGGFGGTFDEWFTYIDPSDREQVHGEWTLAVTESLIFESEFRAHLPSGRQRDIKALAQIVRHPDGSPLRALGTNWDVTAHRTAREQLAAAKVEAERANEAKSQFLAVVSHELRTPMTGVLGMADLLLVSGLDADQTQLATMLKHSAELLLTHLNDILDFSKIEAAQMTLERIEFQPLDIMSDVLQLMSAIAAGKGVGLSVACPQGEPPVVLGDPTRLRQILTNLVGNAVKFTRRGEVVLRYDQVQPVGDLLELCFEVQDTGIGMTESQVANLFRPFLQGDASTTRRFGGTGLGLAICRRLVDMMDGAISVDSVPGRGTIFRVTVRMLAGDPKWARRPSASSLPAPVDPAEHRHILVVEDNDILRLLIGTMLRRMGHDVVVVEHGRRALDEVQAAIFAGRPFDVVLMDMQMPEMDGYEATLALRALPGASGRVPVVALTAGVLASDRLRFASLGISECLKKPIDWMRLQTVVERLTAASAVADRPAASEAETASVFDAVLLQGMSERVGPQRFGEILRAMIERLDIPMARIRRAVEEQDAEALYRAAHDLTGLTAQFGSPGVAELAEMLGTCARTNLVEAAALLTRLERSVDAFRTAVGEFLDGSDGIDHRTMAGGRNEDPDRG